MPLEEEHPSSKIKYKNLNEFYRQRPTLQLYKEIAECCYGSSRTNIKISRSEEPPQIYCSVKIKTFFSIALLFR